MQNPGSNCFFLKYASTLLQPCSHLVQYKMVRILVAGGSGYLGQFVLAALHAAFGNALQLVYLYNTHPLTGLPDMTRGYKADLISGDGLQAALEALGGPVDAVINCAAVSQPAACEADPQRAESINVPRKLVEALAAQRQASGHEALLVHLSTDQARCSLIGRTLFHHRYQRESFQNDQLLA